MFSLQPESPKSISNLRTFPETPRFITVDTLLVQRLHTNYKFLESVQDAT
jgi:hypothetical protein